MERNLLIAFLDRQTFTLYRKEASGILILEIPTEVVRDLEIVNHAKFKEIVSQWIQNNRLSPGNMIVILSPFACFGQDVPSHNPADVTIQTQKFSETVPFEAVQVKAYPWDKGTRLVAVNKDLCRSFVQVVQALGIVVNAIIPSIALPQFAGHRWLDPPFIKYVTSHVDTFPRMSLFELNPEPINPVTAAGERRRLPILLTALFVLIIILAILISQNLRL